jgi:hypothetical protein
MLSPATTQRQDFSPPDYALFYCHAEQLLLCVFAGSHHLAGIFPDIVAPADDQAFVYGSELFLILYLDNL